MSLLRKFPAGFTLVELVMATTILMIIAVLGASIVNGIADLWLRERKTIETFESGRSVLEFVARDIAALESPASVISTESKKERSELAPTMSSLALLQFVHDAGHPNTGLTPWLPAGQTAVTNTGNFFGQRRHTQTAAGNLWVVGYFLTRDTANNQVKFWRVLEPPAFSNGAANANFTLFTRVNSTWGQPRMALR